MRSLASAVCAVALLACAPLPVKTKVKPFDYQGWAATLPSGFRFVGYELPHMKRVMVAVSYRVGSADDPVGREGMAHLVEHLTYRARPGGGPAIWDRVRATGAEFNGFTRPDSTDYFEIGRVEDLDTLLAIEADRLRDPLAGLTEAEFLRERDVVLQELAFRKDPASDLTQFEWLAAHALPSGSAYARATTAESIRAITFDEVKAFVRATYTPARAILVVNGPTGGAGLEHRVTAALGSLAGDPMARVAAVPESPPAIDAAAPVPLDLPTRSAPVEHPILWVAWTVPGDHAGGAPRAIAASDFLEDTLFWAANGANLVDHIVSYQTDVARHAGVSVVYGRIELLRREDAPKLLDALRKERRYQARQLGPDRMFTPFLRGQLLMQGHLALESLEVPEVAHYWRATNDPDFVRGWQRLVAKELTSDTKDYVQTWLRSSRLVGLLVVPSDAASPVPTVAVAGQVARPQDHHGVADATWRAPADLQLAPPAEVGQAVRRTLSNGLQVVVVRRPGFRVLEARLVVPTDAGGPSDLLFRRLALRSSTCGRAPMRVADGVVTFGFDGPSDLSENILRVVSCRATSAHVNGVTFDRSRALEVEQLERVPPSLQERAANALFAELFPLDPRAEALSAGRVKALRSSDVEPWVAATVRPDRAVLTVVGEVEPDEAFFAKLEERFGSWRAKGTPAVFNPSSAAPTRRLALLADRPGWPTADVTVAYRTPAPAKRDAAAHDVLVAALEEQLNADLRIAEGRTYGVWLATTERRMGSVAHVSTVVGAADAGLALTRILNSVERAARTPLADDVLARARWRVARDFDAGFSTAARTSDRLQDALAFGGGLDAILGYPASLGAVDGARVAAAAQGLSRGREVILVLGDAKTIAPQLAAAGIEVKRVEAPPVTAGR